MSAAVRSMPSTRRECSGRRGRRAGDLQLVLADKVRASRKKQGLSDRISDPEVLRRIAVLSRSSQGVQVSSTK